MPHGRVVRRRASFATSDAADPARGILATVNPRDRLRSVGRRVSDPAEALAQQVAERVVPMVVNALDVNELAARVDLNAIAGCVDVDALLKKTDLNALVARLDVNALLDRLDVNALLDRVDLNPLLDRVDVNALLERADVDAVVRRVDVGAVVDRVDVNDVVTRVDMDALVENTDLGAVIARSSGGMVTEALDAARSGAVGLDQFVDRWVARVIRHKRPWPVAPPALLARQEEP